ncbi:MAG: 3D domain-containing protein [Vicinamibacterales bacterium]
MRISRSFRRKLLATVLGASAFVLVYEATVIDSKQVSLPGQALLDPEPGATMDFEATAYCKGQTTASGARVRAGMAAADPKILPIGSVIQVDGVDERYKGIYSVLDTGPEIQGREIDIYIWSCYEALDFGRRKVKVTVLRLGWDQTNTAPAIKARGH